MDIYLWNKVNWNTYGICFVLFCFFGGSLAGKQTQAAGWWERRSLATRPPGSSHIWNLFLVFIITEILCEISGFYHAETANKWKSRKKKWILSHALKRKENYFINYLFFFLKIKQHELAKENVDRGIPKSETKNWRHSLLKLTEKNFSKIWFLIAIMFWHKITFYFS